MPPEWKNLNHSSGKLLSKTARQLLSLIVYHMQPATGEELKELQESYHFFECALGVSQRRVRQCILELETAGFIKQQLRTIINNYVKCRNMLCIRLLMNFQPNVKEISSEPEQNFRFTRKDSRPLYIIDNNISNLEYRYRVSYKIANFAGKNFSVSVSNQIQDLESAYKNAEVRLETSKCKDKPQSGILGGIANKAKKWLGGKKLEEFYPLSQDDADILQLKSNRDFSLSYINKLLIRLSTKYPDHKFYSKSAVINYMTKALANEMRQACVVNNETFNFKTDNELVTQEKYLKEIESGACTSQAAQLHRKIAGVFDSKTAYLLLTSYQFLSVDKTSFNVKQVGNYEINEPTKDKLLNLVQSVYGENITRLEITLCKQVPPAMSTVITASTSVSLRGNLANLESIYSSIEHLSPESTWYKVRKSLIDLYDRFIDRAWFSKLEVIEEDVANKKIILKAPTAFMGDWVSQNYKIALEHAFELQGFSFEMAKN